MSKRTGPARVLSAASPATLILAALILGTAPAALAQAGPPAHHPFEARYSRAGAHPHGGRAGSATLEVQALIGRDGRCEVFLRPGSGDADATPVVRKAQLKVFAGEGGEPLFVENRVDGPVEQVVLDGLRPRQRLQVQGNVTGADPRRTAVVTVDTRAYLRPDLAVRAVDAPELAKVGDPVRFVATVAEQNGDVGASALVVLLVAGEVVDVCPIHVAAGDAVGALLEHTFADRGEFSYEVQVIEVAPVGHAAPGDYDPADNARQGAIAVVDGTLRLPAQLRASEWARRYVAAYRATYFDSRGLAIGEVVEDEVRDDRGASVGLDAHLDRALDYPLILTRAALFDGPAPAGALWAVLEAPDHRGQSSAGPGHLALWDASFRLDPVSGLHFGIRNVRETRDGGATWTGSCQVTLQRNQGTVTYTGHRVARRLMESTSPYTVKPGEWFWSRTGPPPPARLADTQTFRIELVDASGLTCETGGSVSFSRDGIPSAWAPPAGSGGKAVFPGGASMVWSRSYLVEALEERQAATLAE